MTLQEYIRFCCERLDKLQAEDNMKEFKRVCGVMVETIQTTIAQIS
jgi:hypothetical protein